MSVNALGKIAVIGASGWMGQAVLLPMLQDGLLDSKQLILFNRSGNFSPFSAWANLDCSTDLSRVLTESNTVFLTIKPHHLPNLNLDLSNQLLISILAGTQMSTLFQYTNAKRIIRSMPNTASAVGGGFTPYFSNDLVLSAERKAFESWFSCLGLVEEVANERDVDRLTALTGSGHGWVAFFEAAMIEAGVEIGLSTSLASRAVRQLFKGMGELIATELVSPADTVQTLIDYAGTTAAGLQCMRELDIDQHVVRSIMTSFNRAKMNMTKD